MKPVISLVCNIAFAILFVFVGIQVASAIVEEPENHRFLNMESASVWTSVPVHIDVSAQTYERLATPPDPFPLKFRAGARFKILSSTTFETGGAQYQLARVRAIKRNEVCTDAEGRKYACGLRAYKALDNALRGRFVECRIESSTAEIHLVECRVNGRDVVSLL